MDKEYNTTESIEYLIEKLLLQHGYKDIGVKLDPILEDQTMIKYKGKLKITAKK